MSRLTVLNAIGFSLALGGAEMLTLDVCKPTRQNPRHDHQLIFPLEDGRLMLVWSEYYRSDSSGSQSDATRDDMPCRISARTSKDRGRSWGETFVLQENTGKLNVKHPNLLRLPSGSRSMRGHPLLFIVAVMAARIRTADSPRPVSSGFCPSF